MKTTLMSSSRQLAAIMYTDIVGYTEMMQNDEQKAVVVIKHYNAALEKWVNQFHGRIVNYYGDGSLCLFSSATDAFYRHEFALYSTSKKSRFQEFT